MRSLLNGVLHSLTLAVPAMAELRSFSVHGPSIHYLVKVLCRYRQSACRHSPGR